MIPPDKFIPLAEEIGLIGRSASGSCARPAPRPPPGRRTSSSRSTCRRCSSAAATSSAIVKRALAASGIAGRAGSSSRSPNPCCCRRAQATLATLHQLETLGVDIVLDDFGTGYSSLSYLRMFPFDKIKIDKSFVQEMPNRADCAAIVTAIDELGRSLQIDTTAEGVETAEQFTLLQAAGCTQAQGYLFSKPKPVAELNFGPVSIPDRKSLSGLITFFPTADYRASGSRPAPLAANFCSSHGKVTSSRT